MSTYLERGHGATTRRKDTSTAVAPVNQNNPIRKIGRFLEENRGRINPEWWHEVCEAFDNNADIADYLECLCPDCLVEVVDFDTSGWGIAKCRFCST